MPLKGQAKTDYQRDYMRRKRSNKVKLVPPPRFDTVYEQGLANMNEGELDPKPEPKPIIDADGNPIYEY